ncbi:MAG: hypothetical protein ACYCX4_18630, partial [Bacillota bacterium]
MDENNKVIFASDADFELLVSKIWDIQSKPDYRYKAYNLLINDFIKKGKNSIDLTKPSLIMFSTEGCEGCIKAKKEINEDLQLKSKMNIIVIEGRYSIDDSLYIDYLNLYSKIFNVDFYPSYCMIEANGKDIKYYKSIREAVVA